jgi:hypothetical protein
MRTCSPERTWGACAVDETSTRALVPTEGSLSLAGLGAAGACADNPCDPACTRIDDTPTGIDAGGGVAVRDGGLVLEGASTASSSNTCTSLIVEPKPGIVLGADGKTVTVTATTPLTLSPLLVQLQARLAPAGCLGQGVNADQVVPNAAWDIFDDPANPADNDRRAVAVVDATGKLIVVSPSAGPSPSAHRSGASKENSRSTSSSRPTISSVDSPGPSRRFSQPSRRSTTPFNGGIPTPIRSSPSGSLRRSFNGIWPDKRRRAR